MAGTGPEYEYPITGKDEPIPVIANEDPVAYGGEYTEPVVGEDTDILDDKAISAEEELESREAGGWSEDMAQNEPLPGEEPDLLPEETETLPSDRG